MSDERVTLTEDEWDDIEDAVPAIMPADGWEWALLRLRIERVVAARVAEAERRGGERALREAARDLSPQRKVDLDRYAISTPMVGPDWLRDRADSLAGGEV